MALSPFPLNLPSTQDDAASPPLGELAAKNGPDVKDAEATRDTAWYHPDVIDGKRWDQTFPYQLLVLDRADDGTYRRRGDWCYTLPIPPESLTLSPMPAATVTVTQNGIVEELNGIPLRQIEIAGSVGVLPARPAGGAAPRPGVVTSVFAGTIAALGRVGAAGQDVLDDLTGDAKRSTNLIPDDLLADQDSQNTLLRNTGYYQARVMMRFLEAYLNLRRSAKGKSCVLAFAMWKDEAVYLVTPTRPPSLRRGADSPLEYRYTLSLTAWGRVRLDGVGATRTSTVNDATSPAAVAAVLNTLVDARRVLQDARATVEAFVADADRAIFEPIREAILLTKDVLSVPLALIDMPAQIVRDAADTVIAAVAAGEDVLSFPDDAASAIRATKASIQNDLARIKAVGGQVKDRNTVATGVGASRARSPVTIAADGAVRGRAPVLPGTNLFDRPERHADIMGALRPDRLKLPPAVTARIKKETVRVRALTRVDLQARRADLDAAAAAFEDLVGAGSASAAGLLGRPAPRTSRPLTPTGFRVAAALNSASVAFATLSARGPVTADAGVTASLQSFAARAATSSVPFKVPRSKFPVPLPYGTTLEQTAQRYLGSPDRVMEIIALNGLRAPYVDEVGQRLPLLAPGAGRTVVVADVADLHAGQVVWVESNAQPRTKRRVASIDRLDGQATLTLDGAEDLDRFSTVQNAVLHIFAPGTVNSQMLLWIPSDLEPDGSFRVSGIADVAVFDPIASAAGVDVLLTPSNDLVVTPDGDTRWATGLTNLVQLFRILVELRRGTLLDHPDRGLPLRVGDSLADADAATTARALRETLAAEPAFGSLKAVRVTTLAPTTRIEATMSVGGTGITLPLSVELSR